MTIRCATLNLEHGRPARVVPGGTANGAAEFERAVARIGQIGLDVFTVQEADGPARARLLRPGSQHLGHVATLGHRLAMHHVYAPSAFGYGVGIVSRFPIRAARYLRLPPIVKPVYRRDDGSVAVRWPEPRVALFGLLQTPSGPLLVGTTHLDIDQVAAPRQFQIAAKGLAVAARAWGLAATTPMLLTGDMNMRPENIAQAVADISADESVPGRVLAAGKTYPHRDPLWQIDHMLGYRMSAESSFVLDTAISDHCGLVADLVVSW
ncbi:endonuclease/exonuclease/phosphatase family protein [Arcanobacterium pinnipediorum]|uniref:Endonuclease/exonuclease/phosphatase family protein n=1 Tax=Arcanobacterium pinnipediorum TaxID=1503041 RepID=A0ABY5AHB9_9ACTO|nr:endonuclease/exonuclease/phosphatase family protein [Arcanobacterium pinnipediorum]USR79593.1 endonuclease/exonuclease/phosphatase family protein [Arcanobacterium pinnipediorum]